MESPVFEFNNNEVVRLPTVSFLSFRLSIKRISVTIYLLSFQFDHHSIQITVPATAKPVQIDLKLLNVTTHNLMVEVNMNSISLLDPLIYKLFQLKMQFGLHRRLVELPEDRVVETKGGGLGTTVHLTCRSDLAIVSFFYYSHSLSIFATKSLKTNHSNHCVMKEYCTLFSLQFRVRGYRLDQTIEITSHNF